MYVCMAQLNNHFIQRHKIIDLAAVYCTSGIRQNFTN